MKGFSWLRFQVQMSIVDQCTEKLEICFGQLTTRLLELLRIASPHSGFGAAGVMCASGEQQCARGCLEPQQARPGVVPQYAATT